MREVTARLTTEALVIKQMTVGESDRIVTLLTRDYGLIRAFAVGAEKIKSKKHVATGLLSYSSVTLVQKKDTYSITEATPINIFYNTARDIERFSISQYFCELSLFLAPHESSSEEFLRLILNSLYFLAKGEKLPALIKAITELRIAAISGYTPDLVGCCECGKFEDDRMLFDLQNGALYCSECGFAGHYIPIDRTILNAMRHIVYSQFGRLYSFEIPKESAVALSDICEKYILAQTERGYTSLDFYNSVKESL